MIQVRSGVPAAVGRPVWLTPIRLRCTAAFFIAYHMWSGQFKKYFVPAAPKEFSEKQKLQVCNEKVA
jgi:hypothetical protein